MPSKKKTKIVATLGPATSKKEVLREMMNAGVDVFRINFSHANYEDVKERIQLIRELNDELQTNTAIFMIGKHQESYIITSGNPIKDVHIDSLKTKLDQINSLDKDGLKSLYKEIIKSGSGLTDKGGAGLGFVDMARKSGQKLEYEFESLGEGRSFFSLKTTVPRG